MGAGQQTGRPAAAFRPLVLGTLLASGIGLGLAAPAWSQTTDVQRDTERARRGLEPGTAPGTPATSLLLGRDVAYEEVLRRPDDPALNFAYAQTLVRQGDLLGAVGTLERMLLINPNQPRVRLLYAVVLYRLNALGQAEQELEAVLRYQMNDGLRREVEFYLAQTKRQKQLTTFSVLVRAGFTYDSNRNFAPLLDRLEGRDQTIAGPNSASAFGMSNLVRLDVEHDLQMPQRHRLVGHVSAYYDPSFRSSSFSLLAGEIQGGVALDFNPVEIRFEPYWRSTIIKDDLVQNAYGGLIQATYRTRNNWSFFANAMGEFQSYRSTDISPESDLRSGGFWRVLGGAQYIIDRNHRVGVNVGAFRKQAREGFHAYTGFEAGLDHAWLIGRGAFLSSGFSYRHAAYDSVDPNGVQKRRRDDVFRVRATIGAPLATVAMWDEAPREIRDIGISLGAEYTYASSNIVNFRYQNVRVMLQFNKRFDF